MVWLFVILKILLYILLFVVGLLILLLSIPFSYSGEFQLADGIRVRCDVGWAWRLIHFKVDVEDGENDVSAYIFNWRILKMRQKTSEEAEEAKEEKKTADEKEVRKERRGPSLKELTDKSLITELLAYLKKILKLAKPKYFYLKGTYGFDDPSLTGITCGLLSLIKSCIPNAKIQMNPSFTEEVFEVEVAAEGSMIAGILTYETIRMIFKKPVRKVIFRKKR